MFDIKKTIEINLSQDGLEELVRKELAIQHPDVDVTAVEFKATRNPAGVEVRIDAVFRDYSADNAKAEKPKTEKPKVETKKSVAQSTAPSPQPKNQKNKPLTKLKCQLSTQLWQKKRKHMMLTKPMPSLWKRRWKLLVMPK